MRRDYGMLWRGREISNPLLIHLIMLGRTLLALGAIIMAIFGPILILMFIIITLVPALFLHVLLTSFGRQGFFLPEPGGGVSYHLSLKGFARAY